MNSTSPLQPSLRYVYLVDLVCSIGAVAYEVSGQPASNMAALFISFAPIIAVGLWLRRYLREATVALPFDFGFFFMIGWPIVLLVYINKLHPEGRWKLVTKMYALAVAPIIAASVAIAVAG